MDSYLGYHLKKGKKVGGNDGGEEPLLMLLSISSSLLSQLMKYKKTHIVRNNDATKRATDEY